MLQVFHLTHLVRLNDVINSQRVPTYRYDEAQQPNQVSGGMSELEPLTLFALCMLSTRFVFSGAYQEDNAERRGGWKGRASYTCCDLYVLSESPLLSVADTVFFVHSMHMRVLRLHANRHWSSIDTSILY